MDHASDPRSLANKVGTRLFKSPNRASRSDQSTGGAATCRARHRRRVELAVAGKPRRYDLGAALVSANGVTQPVTTLADYAEIHQELRRKGVTDVAVEGVLGYH